jgi:AP-3 complex subunit delta-1
LAVYLQAIPKIFALLAGDENANWTPERKTMISLLMARIIHTLEPLASHPDLEVQERAVEFAELLRLAAEASAGQEASATANHQDTPLLLTQAIPSLFAGLELNSVAPGAQRNVPLPIALDLDQPINSRLNELLQAVDARVLGEADKDEFEVYYYEQPIATCVEPAINRLAVKNDDAAPSYQQASGESYLDPDIIARRRAERRERNKDDPFYIAGSDYTSDLSAPLDTIIQNDNENGLIQDIDQWLEHLAPFRKDYRHHATGEDNGDSHLKSLLEHHQVIVPVTTGKMDFGTWQQIYYAEFDGQRSKRVIVKVMGE